MSSVRAPRASGLLRRRDPSPSHAIPIPGSVNQAGDRHGARASDGRRPPPGLLVFIVAGAHALLPVKSSPSRVDGKIVIRTPGSISEHTAVRPRSRRRPAREWSAHRRDTIWMCRTHVRCAQGGKREGNQESRLAGRRGGPVGPLAGGRRGAGAGPAPDPAAEPDHRPDSRGPAAAGPAPARDGSVQIVPPPPTPPSILAPEVRPIDLATALRLGNVQNPEINVARQRILEAAAQRQLAAAYFLPSINPGMNYDAHSGNLQQSNGNILSVNRSAVFVGAGANAVAAGTVGIPGVFYAGNPGPGLYTYFATKQTVRQREFQTLAVRNQVLLQVAFAYSELLRAEGRRAARIQAGMSRGSSPSSRPIMPRPGRAGSPTPTGPRRSRPDGRPRSRPPRPRSSRPRRGSARSSTSTRRSGCIRRTPWSSPSRWSPTRCRSAS